MHLVQMGMLQDENRPKTLQQLAVVPLRITHVSQDSTPL
jgi:hypothetical protein